MKHTTWKIELLCAVLLLCLAEAGFVPRWDVTPFRVLMVLGLIGVALVLPRFSPCLGKATGVDRNEKIVENARLKELKVVHSDVFEFLEKAEEGYDGMFCSHFLEHLPFGQVVRLVELVSMKLEAGGSLVVVLPNPGSIRLHLFGFWRDPDHVRFYTGNLVASVCEHHGLKVEYSNEEEVPNVLETPRLEPVSLPRVGANLFRKKDRLEVFLREFNQRIEEFNRKMEEFSKVVNKIWARDDEVVLVFKRTQHTDRGTLISG